MHTKSLRRNVVKLESLESRRLLTAYLSPWPAARALTISFPSDGVLIGEDANVANAEFIDLESAEDWKETALLAFQRWVEVADINLGIVSDSDAPFGAAGLTSGDSRFGDIRVGAFPQESVLASSLPFQTKAGTYSGDLLINSSLLFAGQGVAGGAGGTVDSYDLASLLSHEAGNVLGLPDTGDETDIMFGFYRGLKTSFSENDIAAIQQLYGVRTDPFEPVSNDSLDSAAVFSLASNFQGTRALSSVHGSIQNSGDVDTYRTTTTVPGASISVRLRVSGVSLLNASLEIIDSSGIVLVAGESDDVFSNDVVLQIPNVDAGTELSIRVRPKAGDAFAVGDYVLETVNGNGFADQTELAMDAAFQNFFSDNGWDLESGQNDSIFSATVLPLVSSSRFEVQSTISTPTDKDYWVFESGDVVSGALNIDVTPLGDISQLHVRVLDNTGVPAGTAGYMRADGSWRIQVSTPQANHAYYIKVAVNSGDGVVPGKYVASAEFAVETAGLNPLIIASVTSAHDEFYEWNLKKSQLLRFDLHAEGLVDQQDIRMTVYDAFTRESVTHSQTSAEFTRTVYSWLAEGRYLIRFSLHGPEITDQMVQFTLATDGLSDDQGDEDDGSGSGDDAEDDVYDSDEEYDDLTDPYNYDDEYEYEYGYGGGNGP